MLVGAYAGQGIAIFPELYENGVDLIEAPETDLIVITSITDTHREFAVPALRSGKKVYYDKPLAQNIEDAVAIVEVEVGMDNPQIMGFTRRYESAWNRAYALLQDGLIGDHDPNSRHHPLPSLPDSLVAPPRMVRRGAGRQGLPSLRCS